MPSGSLEGGRSRGGSRTGWRQRVLRARGRSPAGPGHIYTAPLDPGRPIRNGARFTRTRLRPFAGGAPEPVVFNPRLWWFGEQQDRRDPPYKPIRVWRLWGACAATFGCVSINARFKPDSSCFPYRRLLGERFSRLAGRIGQWSWGVHSGEWGRSTGSQEKAQESIALSGRPVNGKVWRLIW